MGKTLYFYTVKEQLVPLGICFFGLCFILITGRLMQLMQYLFSTGLTFLDFVQLIGLAMPKLALYSLPMATLIGVLLAFLRLTADNELIVMRAAGIKFSQFLPSVVSVIFLTTVISLYTAMQLMPTCNTLFRQKLKSLARATLPILLKERTFINTIPKMIFYFQNVDASNLTLQGIFVEDRRESGIQIAIVAERGQIIYQHSKDVLVFRILNGIITRVEEDFENAQTVSFREYELPINLDELFQSDENKSKHRTEMTFSELTRTIQGGTLEARDRNRHIMEYQMRFALPLACLVLGLLAAPLGSCFQHGHRMGGVILGLGLFLSYYVLLTGARGLGENGFLPPKLATWIPNLLTLCLGIYLWFKVQRETPVRLFLLLRSWQFRLTQLRKKRG
jgi:lipopolysaccharide export system permease protein